MLHICLRYYVCSVGVLPLSISLKSRLNTWHSILKLVTLTTVIPLFLIPTVYHNSILTAGVPVETTFQIFGIELIFLIFIVLPSALVLLGVGYVISRKAREKRIENAGYGYIAGFLIGIIGIGALFGLYTYPVSDAAGILGVALLGFALGVGLTFLSIKPSYGKGPL